MNPRFMKAYINFKNIPYNLCNRPSLSLPFAWWNYLGTNSVLFIASLVLNRFPMSLKQRE